MHDTRVHAHTPGRVRTPWGAQLPCAPPAMSDLPPRAGQLGESPPQRATEELCPGPIGAGAAAVHPHERSAAVHVDAVALGELRQLLARRVVRKGLRRVRAVARREQQAARTAACPLDLASAAASTAAAAAQTADLGRNF